MSTSQVVRLRTPALGAGQTYRFGSGHLIGPGTVLTVAHALRPPGNDRYVPAKGDSCQVRRDGDDQRGGWVAGTVLASESSVDLAIVSVPELAGDVTPVRWGRLTGGDTPVRWRSSGFPVAGLGPQGRAREDCWGRVFPESGNRDGRLALTIKSRAAKHQERARRSGWAGLSGAAVLCHGHIVGVQAGIQRSTAIA